MKIRSFSILLLSFYIISLNCVHAASLQDLFNRQKNIENQKNSIEKRLDILEDKKDSIEDQMGKINKQISNVQSNLNNINAKLVSNEQKTEEINKQIEELIKKAEEQQNILQTRLRVYYENGDLTYLDVILDSTSLTDLITRVDTIKKIVEFDRGIIDEITTTKNSLDGKKTELESTRNEIINSKKEYEDNKKILTDSKVEKNRIMSKLTEEQRKIEKEYEELEDASNKIAKEIQSAQKGTSKSPYVGGKFEWPTPNYYTITSPYGMRFHPILKTNKMHTGIDIGAPSGASVIAANDGTVIGASYMSGYGNTVIIDHGGGIATLYAHNTSLLVKVGVKVKRGHQVAKVGSTGNSTGPHCHFEVRVNGSTVNPLSYLGK